MHVDDAGGFLVFYGAGENQRHQLFPLLRCPCVLTLVKNAWAMPVAIAPVEPPYRASHSILQLKQVALGRMCSSLRIIMFSAFLAHINKGA